MTTSIYITGQVNGNSVLKNAIAGAHHTVTGSFSIQLVFLSKKAAKKALWEAFKTLRSDKEDAKASNLSYSKDGSISYDASRAQIGQE